jgi:hypothetical protein
VPAHAGGPFRAPEHFLVLGPLDDPAARARRLTARLLAAVVVRPRFRRLRLLSLLVTFLVPIIIGDHVVVFWRIGTRREGRASVRRART